METTGSSAQVVRPLLAAPVLLGLVLLGLVACSSKERRADQACPAALAATGARFEPWDEAPGGACSVATPIILQSVGPPLVPPVRTSCQMALAFATFMPEIERLARTQLGTVVRSVKTMGSWSCRAMTGNPGRPSLHASGRALDIGGFGLEDGRSVDVRTDWYRKDARGRFLRKVGDAACARFQVVLGPPSDRYHHDHLHVDIGRWRLCGLE